MKQFGGYIKPDAPEGVTPVDLSATSSLGPVREPAENERVLCINRGNKPLTDQFDSRHVTMPPGHFEIEYAAAKHFQRRLIVPGTKVGANEYVSYIGICGVNDEAVCQPFTPEELQRFGEATEAIARDMDHGFGRDVKVVPTNQVRAASPTFTNGRGRPGIDASAQANPNAEAAAGEVLSRPTESATREAEAEARGARRGR